jgi:hypothetical protein
MMKTPPYILSSRHAMGTTAMYVANRSGIVRHAIKVIRGTLQGSDVVFAKSYREDVLLTIIWYGPSASYYVSLSAAGGEEQSLVDTLFPSIYGKRRGLALATYDVPSGVPSGASKAYNGRHPVAAVAKALGSADGTSDSKSEERASAVAIHGDTLPAWAMFSKLSVWEASEPVPDPDAVRERDELEAGLSGEIMR